MHFRWIIQIWVFLLAMPVLAAIVRFEDGNYREVFVPLGDGRTISLSTLKTPSQSKRWVIAIPGTTQNYHDAQDLLQEPEFRSLFHSGFNIAYLNKTGIFSDHFDYHMYMDSFRANLRIQDSLAALREGLPGADLELYLVTMSEASYLAPEMALEEPRIKALVMKSGGTRPWLDEELTKMNRFRRKRAKKTVAQIRAEEVPDNLIWHGYPAAALRSFDQIKVKEALLNLKIPVLAILAADDTLIDIKGALQDLEQVARAKDSKLSRVVLLQGGHGLFDRDYLVARHTHSFILRTAEGLPLIIPLGSKSCQFIFDHKLLSLK